MWLVVSGYFFHHQTAAWVPVFNKHMTCYLLKIVADNQVPSVAHDHPVPVYSFKKKSILFQDTKAGEHVPAHTIPTIRVGCPPHSEVWHPV